MSERISYGSFMLFFSMGAIFDGFLGVVPYLLGNVLMAIVLLILLIVNRTPFSLSYVHIGLFMLVFMYGISIIYAVDRENASLEALQMASIIPLSIIVVWLSNNSRHRLLYAWSWVGFGVTSIGVLFQMERNDRLESTIGYANVLAVMLLIGLLWAIYEYGRTRRLLLAVIMIGNGLGLLLTFSRSVWVLWLVSVVVMPWLLPFLRRWRTWLVIGLTHIGSLGLAFVINQDQFVFWRRVASIHPQTSEFTIRLVYWKDSWNLFLDHFFIGTGGGGWSVLLPYYRSQEYYVKYVHNSFLQIGLDVGLVGFMMMVAVLILIAIPLLQQWRDSNVVIRDDVRFAALALFVLFVHAGFDFDFEFPLLWSLIVLVAVPHAVWHFRIQVHSVLLKWSAGLGCVILVILSTWFAIGYSYVSSGSAFVQTGHLEQGIVQFEKAENYIPWSHQIDYEQAKAYILIGNRTGNRDDYEQAKHHLDQAIQRVPRERLYLDLRNQLD